MCCLRMNQFEGTCVVCPENEPAGFVLTCVVCPENEPVDVVLEG